MTSTFTIRPARADDLDTMLALRKEAEQWLRDNGIRQWTADYADYATGALADFLAAGVAWMVEEDGHAVATVSLYDTPDLDFWGWVEPVDQADALYLSKMMVARSHAGRRIGDAILNWASQHAAESGRSWLRLDVRRDNAALQNYYLARGFHHVRTWHAPTRRTESGWLAQRKAGATAGGDDVSLTETIA